MLPWQRLDGPRRARPLSVLALAAALAIAPAQIRLPRTGERASLAGDVLSASTREPVAGIEVRIRLTGDPDWKTTTTDEMGRYSFTGLVPGRYLVSLQAPDYHADQKDVLLRGGGVTSLRLYKRTVLRGRVTDHLGQPLSGIEVCALRPGRRAERVRFRPEVSALTNHDGSFEISLMTAAGELAIGVIPTGCVLSETGRPNTSTRLAGFVPTFFPGVATPHTATIVSVARDQEWTGLNIQMLRGPSTRLTGRVAPLPQNLLPPVARVVLEPLEDPVPIARVLNLGPDGRFAFAGVLPGSYRLIVPPAVRLRERSVWAINTVTVTGAPEQAVFVPTKPTVSVSGQVWFDGQPTLLPGVRVFMTVNLDAERGESLVDASMMALPFGSVDSDGRFVINGVMPGRYSFSVSGVTARGWVLDAATIPGPAGTTPPARDVFGVPFEIKDGEDLFGAVLSLTRADSTLAISVRDLDDRPVIGTEVVLFAASPKYWSPSSGRVLRGRAGPGGVVTFSDLPKGDYIAAVAVKALAGDWSSPAKLELLTASGTRIQLGASETRTLTIRAPLDTVK